MADQTNIWLWDGSAWAKAKGDSAGRLFVVEDHVGVVPVRATATGQVVSGAKALHWITLDPSGANFHIDLTDDTDGASDPIWSFSNASNKSEHMNFVPPIKFSTGIYIKTFAALSEAFLSYE